MKKYTQVLVVTLSVLLLLSIGLGVYLTFRESKRRKELRAVSHQYNTDMSYISLDYTPNDEDIIVDELSKLKNVSGIMNGVDETLDYYSKHNIKPGELYDGVPAIDPSLIVEREWNTKAMLLGFRYLQERSASVRYGGAGTFLGFYAHDDGQIYIAMKFINVDNVLLFHISNKAPSDVYDEDAQVYGEVGVNDNGGLVEISRKNDIDSLAHIYTDPGKYKGVLIPNSPMYIGVNKHGLVPLAIRLVKL